MVTCDLANEYRLCKKLTILEPIIGDGSISSLRHGQRRGMGLVLHRAPSYVEIKVGMEPVKVCQYPMPLEAKRGKTPHIRRLLKLGVLKLTQSTWNMPQLPVKKPHASDYHPVQDLRKANKRVIDIHSTIPNP